MKKFALVCVLMSAAVLSFSQTQTKEKDITRLVEIMNMKSLAVQIFDMLIPQLAQLVPSVPQNVWDLFREKIDIDDFIKLHVAIYDRHFTHEEIKELIRFYESPIGRRVIEETPAMTEESMIAGQQWGMKLGQQIMMDLKKGGYLDT
jgi:hypothetical protein